MATTTKTATIVIVGGREHHVQETPEQILNEIGEIEERGLYNWLRLTTHSGDLIWVKCSLISAFIEAGGI